VGQEQRAQHHQKANLIGTILNAWYYMWDMDCFFAAVALRNYPQYWELPVAISHVEQGVQTTHPSSG
jgi:hypothetical protein